MSLQLFKHEHKIPVEEHVIYFPNQVALWEWKEALMKIIIPKQQV